MSELSESAGRMREATFALLRERDLLAELSIELHPPRLDQASRRRLAGALGSSAREITSVVSPRAAAELSRLVRGTLVEPASDAELRVIHAQLLAWVEAALATLPDVFVDDYPERNGTEPR